LISKNSFPYALVACLALGIFSLTATAQTGDTRERQVAQTSVSHNFSNLDSDPIIISLASAEDIKAALPTVTNAEGSPQFHQLMKTAIDQRLGSPYSWGATGPYAFDCSGFVWSIFKSAGIDFERASARTLWGQFAAPAPSEQYKFGTLVFFSNLAHIGVVADEHGFYHASRHHGVVYSPFNDYWLARVDGFRTVPVPATTKTTD
jgi:peptidoglycan endopeptidase LytE